MLRTQDIVSKRLAASYVLDWIAIIVFGLISYGFNTATPHYHAFSLVDLSISFPFLEDTVSTPVLAVVSVVVPAIIIFLVAVLVVPGPSLVKNTRWMSLARVKFWEWNLGWLGLALSHVTALLISLGLKNVVGKPRPDMLARCMPNLTNLANHVVGGYGQDISPNWVLVNQLICQQPDKSMLNDGFRSFPSGHATTSFAGFLYLSLYLSSKFAVKFPHIPSWQRKEKTRAPKFNTMKQNARPQSGDTQLLDSSSNSSSSPFSSHREQAAAPPLYLLFLPYIPIGAALYISGSRYFDYRHHGFDIIAGALIGSLTATFSFRMYHPRLSRGSGWAWRPRQPSRAFGIGVGTQGYWEQEEQAMPKGHDIEMGSVTRHQEGNTSLDYAQVDGAPERRS